MINLINKLEPINIYCQRTETAKNVLFFQWSAHSLWGSTSTVYPASNPSGKRESWWVIRQREVMKELWAKVIGWVTWESPEESSGMERESSRKELSCKAIVSHLQEVLVSQHSSGRGHGWLIRKRSWVNRAEVIMINESLTRQSSWWRMSHQLEALESHQGGVTLTRHQTEDQEEVMMRQ